MRALEQDVEFFEVNGPGYTRDEAYALLAGVGHNTSTLPLTAAANEGHTGAMIALVPSSADVKRLALKGGEKPEQLHLTLAFLGEAKDITEKSREQIVNVARRYAKTPIDANAFAVNVFNPRGEDPCVVLGVGNGDSSLENVRSNIVSSLRGMSGLELPEQHTPWVPHITIKYTDDFSVVAELADRTGAITFDKIRVAFGDEVTDIPLQPKADPNADVELITAAAGDPMKVLASDRGLRNYWTRGGGAAKIRWGTDGSFDRCVRQLGKHVRNPQGLCAEYHKEATGEWPAEKGVESSMTTPLVAHGSHNQQDHNPHKGFHVPDADYNDDFDAPTRSGRHKELRRLTDKAESDEGITGDEADDLEDLITESSVRMNVLRKKKASGKLTAAEAAELAELEDLVLPRNVKPGVGYEDFDDFALTAAAGKKSKTDLQGKFEKDQDKNSDDFHQVGKRKKGEYSDEPWEGVLAVEGTESGDGRIFNLGSLDWATLPLPLMYQPANVGGHNASVVAGLITHVARKGNEIRGWGHVYGNMLAGDHGEGIRNMMEAGGVSVDVDKVKDADVEEVFAEGEDGGFMAKAETTIFNRGRVRGATLVAFPAFVEAKLAFTGETMTASTDQGCGCGEASVLVASGHTITIPDLPPAEWFQKPNDVKMYGALTITDEGRVFGWVAPSDTTHRSVRKTVPMGSRVDYSRWMNKETIVAGGHRVKTGVLTMGCGHAATSNYGTLQNRKEHYDNTCSIFANAVVGEEPGKGVWFAGALRHGVTADQVTAALGSSLSGDWQPHPDRPGVQEFIAALLVPVPGFPMARSRPSVEYQDGLITASVVPVRYGPAEPRSDREIALDAIAQAKQIIVASLGLDPVSEKRAVMAQIEGM